MATQNAVQKLRYTVNISFKNGIKYGFDRVENIVEPVKTLKEAQDFKEIIDDTVDRACIIDNVTGRVIEWWKRWE